jgi:alpha-galactosidase
MGNQSIKFKTDVAMMGKLGFDIHVGGLKPNELKFCQDAVANYKRLSPIIWRGDLYRLISPYEDTRAVLMYVDEDKTQSIVFSYTLHPLTDPNYSMVKLEGLDPSRKYKVKEINIMPESKNTFEESGNVFSGDFLMKIGLKVSSSREESSVVLELIAVEL